jgi:RNA polymerase Rpb5, N-terminal domain
MENNDYMDSGEPKLTPENEREVTRLWRTFKTVHEMLVDRVSNGKHRLRLEWRHELTDPRATQYLTKN